MTDMYKTADGYVSRDHVTALSVARSGTEWVIRAHLDSDSVGEAAENEAENTVDLAGRLGVSTNTVDLAGTYPSKDAAREAFIALLGKGQGS